MRRIAAHYVWFRQVLPLHYVEMDDKGGLVGIYPLMEEIAQTEFVDGVLIPVPEGECVDTPTAMLKDWKILTAKVSIGDQVTLYRLGGLPLSAAKFGTKDGCGDGYIQRL